MYKKIHILYYIHKKGNKYTYNRDGKTRKISFYFFLIGFPDETHQNKRHEGFVLVKNGTESE